MHTQGSFSAFLLVCRVAQGPCTAWSFHSRAQVPPWGPASPPIPVSRDTQDLAPGLSFQYAPRGPNDLASPRIPGSRDAWRCAEPRNGCSIPQPQDAQGCSAAPPIRLPHGGKQPATRRSFYSSAFGLTLTCIPVQSCAREAEGHAPGGGPFLPARPGTPGEQPPFPSLGSGTGKDPPWPGVSISARRIAQESTATCIPGSEAQGTRAMKGFLLFGFLPQPSDGRGIGSPSIPVSRDESGAALRLASGSCIRGGTRT